MLQGKKREQKLEDIFRKSRNSATRGEAEHRQFQLISSRTNLASKHLGVQFFHRPLSAAVFSIQHHAVGFLCPTSSEGGLIAELLVTPPCLGVNLHKVRGQKDPSDTGVRAKFDIFKPTILNTVCMETLQILSPAREPQSIQTPRSRSTKDQSSFHCL